LSGEVQGDYTTPTAGLGPLHLGNVGQRHCGRYAAAAAAIAAAEAALEAAAPFLLLGGLFGV
jgi:hypothetical protein